MLKLLLDNGADANCYIYIYIYILLALTLKTMDICQLLIDNGAQLELNILDSLIIRNLSWNELAIKYIQL